MFFTIVVVYPIWAEQYVWNAELGHYAARDTSFPEWFNTLMNWVICILGLSFIVILMGTPEKKTNE